MGRARRALPPALAGLPHHAVCDCRYFNTSFVFAALTQLGLLRINQYFGTHYPIAGWGSVAHMIFPALMLGLGTMAYLTRLMRSSMLRMYVTHTTFARRKQKAYPLHVFSACRVSA